MTAEIVKHALNEVYSKRAKRPFYYADFNAISPSTTSRIADFFGASDIKYIDGGVGKSHP